MYKVLPLFLLFLFVSCSSTYFQLVSIESTIRKDSDQYFYENQDLKIKYSFWSNGGVLAFTIENKTEKPLFFDWEHSNFILNGYSYDYFTNSEEFSLVKVGVYESKNIQKDIDNNIESIGINIDKTTGNISKEKKSVQIPPKAYIIAKIVDLDFPIYVVKKNQINSFSSNNSPLNIRTYLAYSFDKELTKLSYLDNEFWVSSLVRLSVRDAKDKRSEDKFYRHYKKPDPIKTGILFFGVLGGLALIIIPSVL